jgi:hypothetical protein
MQLTVNDVAGLQNISEKTVYRRIGEHNLSGPHLNGPHRFDPVALPEQSAASRTHISPRQFDEAEKRSGDLPQLSSARECGIFYAAARSYRRNWEIAGALSSLRQFRPALSWSPAAARSSGFGFLICG